MFNSWFGTFVYVRIANIHRKTVKHMHFMHKTATYRKSNLLCSRCVYMSIKVSGKFAFRIKFK